MEKQNNSAVIYRTGGTINFKWNRVIGLFSREAAAVQQAELEQMGYPALVHDAARLDAIGLPETFSAEISVIDAVALTVDEVMARIEKGGR